MNANQITLQNWRNKIINLNIQLSITKTYKTMSHNPHTQLAMKKFTEIAIYLIYIVVYSLIKWMQQLVKNGYYIALLLRIGQ